MSGYRLAMERHGLRSKIRLVNPATGGIAAEIPDKHPGGGLFGRGSGAGSAAGLLATVRTLPPAGPPPDTSNPELMRGVLLALALGDDSVGGAEAAELADRALPLTTGDGPRSIRARRWRRPSPAGSAGIGRLSPAAPQLSVTAVSRIRGRPWRVRITSSPAATRSIH